MAKQLKPSEQAKRIEKLAKGVKQKKLDAMIIITDVNRYYLTLFRASSATLVVMPGDTPCFFTDFRYLESARREIDGVSVGAQGGEKKPLIPLAKKMRWKRVGYEGSITAAQLDTLKESLPDVREWINSESLLIDMRAIKSKSEQDILRRAVHLGDEVYARTIAEAKPGLTEWDMRRTLRYWADKMNSEGESFDCIIAAGANASRCHHHPGERVLRSGQPLLIDMGVLVEGYHSDMTRTIFLDKASPKMKEIYKIVLDAQLKAISKIKAGVPCSDIDKAARSLIKHKGYVKKFGHGLGHGVGLQIHEAPAVSGVSETILKPGMVITIEPGIYLPGVGGVRIEDVVLVKRNGCEVFTQTPKEMQVI